MNLWSREWFATSIFLVPAMPDPGLLGCVWWRVVQELVAWRDLLEHAGKARGLSCREGGRRHIQPCEQVPRLSLLSIAQTEQCQRGSVGG